MARFVQPEKSFFAGLWAEENRTLCSCLVWRRLTKSVWHAKQASCVQHFAMLANALTGGGRGPSACGFNIGEEPSRCLNPYPEYPALQAAISFWNIDLALRAPAYALPELSVPAINEGTFAQKSFQQNLFPSPYIPCQAAVWIA